MKIQRLKKMMEEKKLNGLLITDIPTITYATGLYFEHWAWSGAGLFLPLDGEFIVLGNALDRDRIQHLFGITKENYLSWHPPLGDYNEVSFTSKFKEAIVKSNITSGVIGYDRKQTNPLMDEKIKEELSDMKQIELKDVSDCIDNVMMIKDLEEIKYMRNVAAIADAGITQAIKSIEVGRREVEIAGDMSKALHYAGAQYTWARVNVNSGYRNYMDTWTSGKVIQNSDIMKVACHPAFNHYRGDTLRTICVGKPSDKVKKLIDVTYEAGIAMMDKMKPGVTAAEVDLEFRRVMKKNNFENLCFWRTGHGLGTRHLPPYMHSKDETVFQPGMVIVVQPFAYYPEGGGFSLEHMVLVTDDGIEHLNKIPLNLIEV